MLSHLNLCRLIVTLMSNPEYQGLSLHKYLFSCAGRPSEQGPEPVAQGQLKKAKSSWGRIPPLGAASLFLYEAVGPTSKCGTEGLVEALTTTMSKVSEARAEVFIDGSIPTISQPSRC